MEKINSDSELSEAIRQLEVQQADDEKQLKEQFSRAFESIKPINLIKNTFKEAAASRDLKEDILKASVGLAAGYIFKKSIRGKGDVSLTKIFGSALLYSIVNAAAKNPEAVKAIGKGVFNLIRSKPVNEIDKSAEAY